MNAKSFFFLIMVNPGQWRTKVDKTTKTRYDKAVAWGTRGKGEKEWFTVRVSPFQFIPAWQTSQKLTDTYLKNFPWHSRSIFYFKPGLIINTPNVKERLFRDLSLWALGTAPHWGLTQLSLSAVFKVACERRRISGCRENLDSRKYVCVRRLCLKGIKDFLP